MTTYILRRLLLTILAAFGVAVIVFVSLEAVPGDAALARAGEEATIEQIEALRRELGLNRPAPVRFLAWLGGLLRGDLGNSLNTGRPILPDILNRAPATLELATIASIVSLMIAVPLGILAATHHNSAIDFACRILSLAGSSIPNFMLGILAVLVISLKLGLLPPSGFVPFLENPTRHLKLLVLPALSLGSSMAAVTMRMTRSALLEVLHEDYMRTARAKGLQEHVVVLRHGVPNALRDVMTVVGMQFGYMLGGSVVVETVFNWPGIGMYLTRAVTQRDYPTAQGAAILTATFFLLVNLIIDVLYTYVDPRVSYE